MLSLFVLGIYPVKEARRFCTILITLEIEKIFFPD